MKSKHIFALSPNSDNSSGTSTPSVADFDKLVATLKESNDIERERFETDKKIFENEKEMT
jgi:hypothetical protein